MARPIYIDTDARAFVKGPTDQSRVNPADFFNQDKEEINLYFLERTGVQGRPFAFLDKAASSARVGLGVQRAVPTDGELSLTWEGDTTTQFSQDASADVVSTAFNALASVVTAGGATITKATNSRRWRVKWTTNGARSAITANTTEVIPSSTATISE